MSRKRRTFTREFKAEAVRLVHGGREETEVGVRTDTLRNWVRHADGRAGLAPEQIGVVGKRTDAEEEIRRLRREVEVLKEERDFSKKAERRGERPVAGNHLRCHSGKACCTSSGRTSSITLR
jgi:transposase